MDISTDVIYEIYREVKIGTGDWELTACSAVWKVAKLNVFEVKEDQIHQARVLDKHGSRNSLGGFISGA